MLANVCINADIHYYYISTKADFNILQKFPKFKMAEKSPHYVITVSSSLLLIGRVFVVVGILAVLLFVVVCVSVVVGIVLFLVVGIVGGIVLLVGGIVLLVGGIVLLVVI